MKTKNLFLTVVLLFIATLNYAQTSAEASGIAIQGIARDAGNTARINTPITLTFDLYYLNGTTIVPIGSPVDANLTTDNFGVFSYVLEAGVENNAIMANHQAYLKISESGTTISDEKLNHVPYAIAANNGVPTGSIMPFVGTSSDVPNGWVLCDGQTLPTTATKLITMIGNNAPDLGGMFLRGAGANTNDGYEPNDGPLLNEIQGDSAGPHAHPDNIEMTVNSNLVTGVGVGELKFGAPFTASAGQTPGIGLIQNIINVNTTEDLITLVQGITSPDGTTDKTGGVQTNTGVVETRPVNYGVNYIIKL
jgi:hypothetical protein